MGVMGVMGKRYPIIPMMSQTSHDTPALVLPPRGDYQTLISYQKS